MGLLPPGKHMSFVRILALIVVLLAVVVAGLAIFRPDPDAAPTPIVETAPAASRAIPVVTAPARQLPANLSPADASSPAEITAREALEAQRRLEGEANESHMMTPDMTPAEMMPPDVAPPVK